MATPPYQAAYQALIDSLNAAGQVTQAQFQAVSEQFTAAQFAQMAESAEQLSYVQNLDESIRFYQMTNPDCQFALAPSSTGSGLINSNTIPPTNSLKNTFTSTVASSSALNILDMVLAMGEVRKPAQTGTQKAVAFASKVCLPVQIASVATMLGKQIDGTIYQLATELGLHPPAALDPNTWDGMVSNDTQFGQIFNYLLNVDPETGELSAYADLDSVAYSAWWLKEQGFFNTGEAEIEVDNPDVTKGTKTYTVLKTPILVNPSFMAQWFRLEPEPVEHSITGDYDIAFGLLNNNRIYWYLLATHEFTYTSTINNYANSPTTKTINTPFEFIAGYPIYMADPYTGFANYINASTVIPPQVATSGSSFTELIGGDTNEYKNALFHILLYQSHVEESPAIPGVDNNGGELPDTSTWQDLQSVKDSILNQYPDIDADPIEVDTVQPDGSTRQYTYVPVPLPGDIDPLGNPDTQNIPATDISVDPETATDPQLQMIIQLLTQLSPLLAPEPSPETEPDTPGNDGSNEDNPDYPGSNDIGTGIAPLPVVPTGTASALWTVYNPSQSELNSFGGWLWSPAFIDNVLKLFSNPMDGIIGIHKIFAPVPSGSHKNIKCGFLDSGVSAATVNTQYIDVDCGTVNLSEYFGNVFDYDPNTKVSVYLPFIGVVPLKTAEVMRSSINITYGVDLYTGACLAKIRVSRDAGAGGILYSYGGSCACYYPLSAGSYSGIISGIASSAVGITGALLTQNPMAAIGAIAGGVAKAHTDVQHTGGFTGPSGVMGPKSPYLIILRPQTKMANDYQSYDGVPANSTETIGNCHGYTRCKEVHLNIPGAYYNELQEIESILKGGVIL